MRNIRTQPNIARRALATIIDYGIYLAFWFWYIFQFGSPKDEGGYSVSGWSGFILFLTWFIYFPLVESFKGQTIGHMIVQLKVVTVNGNPISFGRSLKRRILDGLELFITFGIVAFITVKNSERNQRVGDIWAKTIVVGGESVICKHCHAKLTLSAKETIIGSFDCPECGNKNEN
ncbi:RDD family protein [Marivirga sp.]|uniref:RDD family protein n=1 Tax=Marivirga sp. TaxID=2018662 RepID=UPI0025FDD9FF|nr:RDD family protein [Marivirga sp.]